MTEILLKKENILLIILGLFFFLFSVKFTFIPVHSYLIVLLLGILYVTVDYIKNKKTLFVLTVEIRNFIYIFLLLLLWILISYGFNGFEDSYMIKKIIQPYEGRPLTDITKQSVISTILYELQEYGLRNMEYDSNFADAEIKMYPMFDIQIYYIGDNGLKQIDLYTEID
mgnify:CR=1 FL=1